MTKEPTPRDVIKKCNVNASGCHVTYNLTARSEEELSQQFKDKQRPKYRSYYDGCDAPACQGRSGK